jgi:hypothetical protein
VIFILLRYFLSSFLPFCFHHNLSIFCLHLYYPVTASSRLLWQSDDIWSAQTVCGCRKHQSNFSLLIICTNNAISHWTISKIIVRKPTFRMKNGVFWVVTPCGSCKNRLSVIYQLKQSLTRNNLSLLAVSIQHIPEQ